ncbi:hypothetical protein B0A50_06636 [Salinomyces thailandicus]|uniref:SWR1-complex protein 5 n=1 Tax=Salinomyces thailandicus TaxID=706561 RepID=A0A4V5N3P5_9PEZI|nr:hypothetical protein B0A50_06636 [Salinomyces thailandica]
MAPTPVLRKAGEQTALERDMQEDGEEEGYDENADEDFDPEQAGEGEEGSSSEDEDTAASKPVTEAPKRKVDAVDGEALDSGDEATISERKKKKRRKQKDAAAAEDDDDGGGEGGFVRTRAQRLAEKAERKEKKRMIGGEVTIDVEQMWRELNSIPLGRPAPPPSSAPSSKPAGDSASTQVEQEQGKENTEPDELITITRNIAYAGTITEITERVPRKSKAAQLYLQTHPSPSTKPNPATDLRRPLKRPSLFEPNPTALVKGVPPERLRPRAPSRLDVLLAAQKSDAEARKKAERMTTVQKSALDWRGFVEGERGLREELEGYGKGREGFLAREEFLGRVDLAKEARGREARLKG